MHQSFQTFASRESDAFVIETCLAGDINTGRIRIIQNYLSDSSYHNFCCCHFYCAFISQLYQINLISNLIHRNIISIRWLLVLLILVKSCNPNRRKNLHFLHFYPRTAKLLNNQLTCKAVAKHCTMMATKRCFPLMFSHGDCDKILTRLFYTATTRLSVHSLPSEMICKLIKILYQFFLNDPIYYFTQSIYQTYVCLYNRSPLTEFDHQRGGPTKIFCLYIWPVQAA